MSSILRNCISRKVLLILTLLSFVLDSALAQVQPAEKHLVKKGETFYSISKRYSISQQELINLNPGIESGLREGSELTIRKSSTPASASADEPIINGTIPYIVTVGDTWYSLAKKYGTSIEAIKKANGLAGDELQINQKILIPVIDSSENVHADVDSQAYSVAYMLPFYTGASDSLIKKYRKYQRASIQFYRGSMMAIKQMEASGLRADVQFYDVQQDTNSVKRVLSKLKGNLPDLCIGPLFKESITKVLSNINSAETHLAMPVQQPSKLLLLKKNLSKVVPGAASQYAYLASYLIEKESSNCVLLHHGKDDEIKLVNSFMDEWRRLGGGNVSQFNLLDSTETAQLKILLDKSQAPTVIFPSSDEGRIRKFISEYKRFNLTVYGNEIWLPLSENSVEAPASFKVFGLSTEYIDMTKRSVMEWIEKYRVTYISEPDEFAFLGYDVSIFYLCGLAQFGKEFWNHLNNIEAPMITHVFDFVSTGVESGFENRHTEIIGLSDDGELKIVNQ